VIHALPKRRTRIVFGLFAVACGMAGCADLAPRFCPAGLKDMTQAELFFGRDIPTGGMVTDRDWQSFLDEEVTPRFPDGLTVEDASGQWRDRNGIVREASKRLTIVLSGASGEQAKLSEVRQAYKARFKQNSVLILEYRVCGSF
jgi:hypothetical protein